jgi:MFS transporter, DHA1 family, multidrug resistance protein
MFNLSKFNVLCLIGFLARFSYALARNPVLPLFALSLGAGPEAIGLAVGISTVTGILFKLPSGALSDVIGRRRTMLIGLVFFAFVPFAYLLIDSYAQLAAVRFMHGFATAVYGPVAMAVVADIAGERKGELLSWFSSVGIIGGLLGAPLGGLILSLSATGGGYEPWSFQLVYLVCGVSGVTALALAFGTLLRDEHVQGNGFRARLSQFFSGIREVISDVRVVVTSSVEGLQNMTMGALEAFLPIYAVEVAGLSAFEAGLLWAVQIAATMVSKPLMGKMSDRVGRKRIIVTGLVLCAISFAAIPLLKNFAALSAVALLFGLGEAFVTSSSAAMVADMCKARHFGTAMGVFGTIFDVGHASGPILGGILIAAWGYLPAFALMAAVLILAIPIFVLTVCEKEPHTGEQR